MIRFEPGHHPFAALDLRLPEAHKGVHLVQIAAQRLFHAVQPVHQRIAGDGRQRRFAVADAPDQLIQQRVTLRVAVADQQFDHLRHLPRQGNRRRLGQDILRENGRHIVEHHVAGRHGIGQQPPQRRTEAIQVGAMRQRHTDHPNNPICLGTMRARKSARSVSIAGE